MPAIAFDRFGEGEPLLLVHGIGSRRAAWRPAAERVAADREVIAVDLPGFGETPLQPGVSSVEDFVRVLQDFLAAQGIERPHFAGNSLGGGIGLELARLNAVRSLTAFSPIGFATRAERRWAHTAFRAGRALGTLPPPKSPAWRARLSRPSLFVFCFGNPWKVDDEEILATVESSEAAGGWDDTLPAISRYAFNRPEELRGVPTTIAWGTRDVLIPAWTNPRRAREALPWASHVSLRGCGHVPFFDDPEACARVLLEGSVARG
jgi:pimeloyl-ACP methyl ester carboxylesterase